MDSDPFDDLLGLEDKFYDEGYKLGEEEGAKAGRIEGRVFGLEKGFEKYLEMGRLHGRSLVWAGRLPSTATPTERTPGIVGEGLHTEDKQETVPKPMSLPLLARNPRLEKHIRVLHALSEPASLSTDNTEEAVSDFDDRLKRAQAKIKITERLVAESVPSTESDHLGQQVGGPVSSDNNIEDVNILKARH